MIDMKKGLRTLVDATQLILAFMIVLVIGVIIGGVLINAVTGGSIDVSSGFNTVLNSLDSTTSGWFTTMALVGTTIVGLVVVAVIVILFRKYVSLGGKGKGGSSM
jgi:hypothetical protein